ncbi:hypothetical protein E2C01_078393 [Portunus trituberculatus]|uniref:Uncharacterized protein n=1 Tax=Portunus trituberculatus TaxID=210409 RepID=A0A5B7ISM6_PORTR|nr:hypothetical protein [Portunus trituberculatus]
MLWSAPDNPTLHQFQGMFSYRLYHRDHHTAISRWTDFSDTSSSRKIS